MLSLAIHHNIWLTRQQRYQIHEEQELTVTGVCVPVWVESDRKTSEPAKEVFCSYYLKNTKIDLPIQILKDGFGIVLPYREGTIPKLSNEDWRYLNFNDPAKLNAYYYKCSKLSCSKNLLDIKDGGTKCLSFREHNKVKKDEQFINFIHFVNIMDIEELMTTLI